MHKRDMVSYGASSHHYCRRHCLTAGLAGLAATLIGSSAGLPSRELSTGTIRFTLQPSLERELPQYNLRRLQRRLRGGSDDAGALGPPDYLPVSDLGVEPSESQCAESNAECQAWGPSAIPSPMFSGEARMPQGSGHVRPTSPGNVSLSATSAKVLAEDGNVQWASCKSTHMEDTGAVDSACCAPLWQSARRVLEQVERPDSSILHPQSPGRIGVAPLTSETPSRGQNMRSKSVDARASVYAVAGNVQRVSSSGGRRMSVRAAAGGKGDVGGYCGAGVKTKIQQRVRRDPARISVLLQQVHHVKTKLGAVACAACADDDIALAMHARARNPSPACPNTHTVACAFAHARTHRSLPRVRRRTRQAQRRPQTTAQPRRAGRQVTMPVKPVNQQTSYRTRRPAARTAHQQTHHPLASTPRRKGGWGVSLAPEGRGARQWCLRRGIVYG